MVALNVNHNSVVHYQRVGDVAVLLHFQVNEKSRKTFAFRLSVPASEVPGNSLSAFKNGGGSKHSVTPILSGMSKTDKKESGGTEFELPGTPVVYAEGDSGVKGRRS